MTGADGYSSSRPVSFICLQRASQMILPNQFGGEDLVQGLPQVICFWVPLPFYQVLKLLSFPMITVINDFLHFKLFFTPYQVRLGLV